MLRDILTNVIAALIVSAIAAVYKFWKKTAAENKNQTPGARQMQTYSKRTIKRQFHVCIAIATACSFLLAALHLGEFFNIIGTIKIFSGVLFYFSLIFMWGAFDAALEFVPDENNPAPDTKTKNPADRG